MSNAVFSKQHDTSVRLSESELSAYPIVVHSHLSWNWVWQRPQQFLSRLSKRHRIFFVEGPLVEDVKTSSYKIERLSDFLNIWRLQTTIPAAHWGDAKWVDEERLRIVRQVLANELSGKFKQPVQWFYDPMAVTSFAGRLEGERVVVYDCMDELSQFKGAPPQLVQRERDLLKVADVVFTGGRKMYESKVRFNSNCHFYGCGVDVAHFGQARAEKTEIPADIAHLNGPILGYFGVVDERLDYKLIDQIAATNPKWNVVMVGPVCKIDAKTLPQRPNLHWLGGREYSILPAYCKAFDVCLMPFALNEATEYINPTKALEYMATATPIVSSAVPDVVSNFSRAVAIAKTSDEFIALCEKALNQTDAAQIERGLQMANENTWDAIVACLEHHIDTALPHEKTVADFNLLPKNSQPVSV